MSATTTAGKEIIETGPQVLRKAREAVFSHPTNGSRTLLQHKLLNVMLWQAAKNSDDDWHQIPLTLLARNTAFTSNDMSYLRETVERMQKTLVRWDEEGKDGATTHTSVQLIGRVEWHSSRGPSGKVVAHNLRYRFDPDIRARLLKPSVYALIDETTQNIFRSVHSLVLYEILVFELLNGVSDEEGWRYITKRPWKEWRDQLCGSDKTNSDVFKYFNRDVLTKAINEIKEILANSGRFEFEHEVFREGRFISDIQFRVRPLDQGIIPLVETSPIVDIEEITERVLAMGVKRKDVPALLDEFSEESLVAALSYVEERLMAPNSTVTNPSGYFLRALHGKWGEPKLISSTPAVRLTKKKLEVVASAEAHPSDDDTNRKQRDKDAEIFINTIDPSRLDELFAQFSEKTDPETRRLIKKGLGSLPARRLFVRWVATNLDDLIDPT